MNKRSGEETRQLIMEAARTVFGEHGYERASMRIIAAAAGISVGGLYLYFQDKETLFRALTEENLAYLHNATCEALHDIKDPRKALAAFINLSINHAVNNRQRLLLHGRELGFSFALDIKRKFFHDQRKLLEEIIARGIQEGIFSPHDPTEVAKIVFNVLRGFLFSLTLDEEGKFSADNLVNILLLGLLKRDQGQNSAGPGAGTCNQT